MPPRRKRQNGRVRSSSNDDIQRKIKQKQTFCEIHRRGNCANCLMTLREVNNDNVNNDDIDADTNNPSLQANGSTSTLLRNKVEVEPLACKDANNPACEHVNSSLCGQRQDTPTEADDIVSFRQHTEPVSTTTVFKNKRCLGRVNLKCPEDTNQYGTCVVGLVVTSDNKLVVCDHNNMAFKMADIQTDRVLWRLPTTAHPRGITLFSETIVAATIPDEYKIVFLDTSDQALRETRVIITEEKCHHLIYHMETFIVSCALPGRILTLDANGVILKSFETRTSWQDYYEYAGFIALSLDKKSIYVTNSMSACITQFSLEGEPLNEFAHHDTRGASGLAVHKTGDVYVGTWNTERGTVVKLSSDLVQPQLFMDDNDGVLLPSGIFMDSDCRRLFLSNSLYIANDFVSIYDIDTETVATDDL